MERIITLHDLLDVSTFFGVNNANVVCLQNLFPNAHIVARGNTLRITADEPTIERFYAVVEACEDYCEKNHVLPEDVIIKCSKGERVFDATDGDGVLLHGVSGKPIKARSANQQKLIDSFAKHDLLFAIGPAGSGKTYIAIALAVRALKDKQVKKIILTRPAVEAGEKLGFLPGDLKEKVDPYLQPLYDALEDMIPGERLQNYLDKGVIQIAPLAYMRGRTLSDAVVILDEAQNTTVPQIKMFLTRLGIGGKMLVTGDLTQVDLPASQKSGLRDALERLEGIKGIDVVRFEQEDIVRHALVGRIVEAYSKG